MEWVTYILGTLSISGSQREIYSCVPTSESALLITGWPKSSMTGIDNPHDRYTCRLFAYKYNVFTSIVRGYQREFSGKIALSKDT